MAQPPESAGAVHSASLRDRVPAHGAMTGFLASHDQAPPPSRLARSFGASPLDEESGRRYRRVLGELGVGESLARLDSRWTVLHAIPQGEGQVDIDHLAIGPAGVLCIRTIDVGQQIVSVARGALWVAGIRSSHLRESEFEVGRAERALGMAQGAQVKAIGVIVVVDPHSITVRDMPRDVVVVDPAGLVGALEGLPDCLDEHEIRLLVAHAEKPSTWLGIVSVPQDGDELRTRFASVCSQVHTARAVRRLWIVAISTALLGVVFLAAWGIVLATTANYAGR
ncbi:nuclease-related domain-containing protein [Marisediminicola antarctica]|uniref:NERD domain-containing protein n=1 Tax=Marisediminicola antarctica TaxID=674079 RepID=A0A7L5AQ72_9MICO|nr:nuclease-related domain-containing protein [Marisediminicola antarctica]QHO70519.1 hypothetical protein BHD05_13535 [Marisediminicola antarctica]